MRTVTLFLLLTGSRMPLPGQANHLPVDRVTVFVSPPMRDGFVDSSKAIQDSIKDAQVWLRGRKEFRLLEDRENAADADIVFTIMARGAGRDAFERRVLFYSQDYADAALMNTPVYGNTLWVAGLVEVGRYRKELVGLGVTWNDCATSLFKEIRSWVIANEARLKQRRDQMRLAK